jgi:hypothetical protein
MTTGIARAMVAGFTALWVAGLGGCASSTLASSGDDPFSQSTTAQQIQIKVVNLNFQDATIWALISGGRRQRLGIVSGKREAEFTLPWRFSEPLRLEFDLVAGPRCVTEDLTVDPGDLLELQIASDFYATPGCR